MGSSLTRVKATMGAPERSGPYSGKAWKYLLLAERQLGDHLGRGHGALAAAAVPADLREAGRPVFCVVPLVVAMVTPLRAAGCDARSGRGPA